MNKPKPYTRRRAFATLIDYTIVFSFTFWYIFTFGQPNGQGGYSVSGLPALVPVIFWFVYIIAPENFVGATLGHYLNGLKVISSTGRELSFGQVLKRRLVDIIEISWCFGFIAFILVKTTPLHQRLGDILANTFVVDKYTLIQTPEFNFEKFDAEI